MKQNPARPNLNPGYVIGVFELVGELNNERAIEPELANPIRQNEIPLSQKHQHVTWPSFE